jgi:hypothetical protein
VHDLYYGRYGLLVYCVATAIVLWRLTQPRPGALGAALSWEPVRWLGAISYEMYLWHWPTYLVVTQDRTGLDGLPLLAVRLSVVVALAWATARLVDDPIRRGVRLRSPRLARVMIGASVIVIGSGVFAATIGGQPALSGQVGQVADRRAPPTTRTPDVIKVLVVGDSQAATLHRAFGPPPGSMGSPPNPASRSGTGRSWGARS